MRLRTRILLGYWYLVALLVISASGAALGFHNLGSNIDRVLTENFESVRASMFMVESLERQDSALLALLLGKEEARTALDASQVAFSEALDRARSNITLTSEIEVIDDIERSFQAFTRARDRLLEAAPEHPLRAYEEQTFPEFESVKSRVLDLLEINHQAMVEADRAAQNAAFRRAVNLAILVLIALFSLAFISRGMSSVLLDRLDELAAVAEAIAAGSFDRRASVALDDELGVVSRQLNAVLDRQQEHRGTMEGRVSLYRGLLMGLLGSLPRPAAVLGFDGRVLASTLDQDDEELLRRGPVGPLHPARDGGEIRGTIEVETTVFGLELLNSSEGRPVAWLVAPIG